MVSGDKAPLPRRAHHSSWHQNRFARRSRDAHRPGRAGSDAAEARAGPEAGEQDTRCEIHGVLRLDAARPQAGVRGSGARGAETRAAKATPAKVFSYVNKVACYWLWQSTKITRKRHVHRHNARNT